MMFITNNYIILILLGYFLISYLVFNQIYNASNLVIDELFHIPQGLLYCNGNFTTWNPKITTLPGLYLISALFLGPLNLCTTYYLRFVNLLASVVNLYLLICIVHKIQQSSKKANISIETLLTAVNISILPPLYFFSHLYYTDTLSVTFVLLIVIFFLHQYHVNAAISGIISVLLRQTNIIWVGLCFGQLCFKFLNKEVVDIINKLEKDHGRKQTKQLKMEEKTILSNSIYLMKSGNSLKFIRTLILRIPWRNLIPYGTILISFIVFVYINGSIVVGDKSAHQAKLHLPQVLYFSLFYLIFGSPFMLLKIKQTIKQILESPIISTLVLIGFLFVIHFNTIVHPYLLADNRHYTFYIWNRILNRNFARYGFSLIYLFSLKSFYDNLRSDVICYNFLLVTCIFLVLVFQSMIEVRYFLIPYILLRLKFSSTRLVLLLEFVINLFINVMTIRIFLTKEIIWTDFDDVQRLIW